MTAGAETVATTGDPDIDGLLSGSKWDTLKLSYSFFASEANLGGHVVEGFAPFAERERLMTKSILDQVSSFTNLTFAAAQTPAGGDLRFGAAEMSGAHAYYPDTGFGGDSWYSKDAIGWGSDAPGDNLHYTFVHEIGHALGLKHGHEHPRMTPEHLGHEFSVMTYTSWIGQNPDFIVGWGNENGGFPQTFMMYDIAALQRMYGANYTANSGDTVYRWDPATGQMFIDGAGQAVPYYNRIFMTLWDGGGSDTYDLSNYDGGVKIDLAPGGWSTFSKTQLVDLNFQGWDVPATYARGNVANALLFEGDTRSLIENAIGGDGNDRIRGNGVTNRIDGGAGNDRLDGVAGDDLLAGGLGDDLLVGGAGLDLADYSMAAAAVKVSLALTGAQDTLAAGSDVLTAMEGAVGSAFADRLDGSGGANLLRGGGGHDRLGGGAGEDVLQGDAGSDRLSGGAGSDTAAYGSAASAVTVDLRLSGAQDTGGGGIDTLLSIEGASGSAFADRLTGTGGANRLDGASGADTLVGLGGDDTYVVDRASDRAVETRGGGTDTVLSSIGWTLGGSLENLVLTGTAIAATGNSLANRVTGNSEANLLSGAGGDDRLEGGAGDDQLRGGAGADRMNGGLGNDLYVVNAGDIVAEAAGGGEDRVQSAASWTLAAHVEQLELTGSAAVNGVGNGGANNLIGNDAANVLSGRNGDDRLEGGLGDDRMEGGAGKDVYIVDSTRDQVVEAVGAGLDTVESAVSFTLGANVENLILIGSRAIDGSGDARDNSIFGNGAANTLRGLDGDDRIDGGAGDDRLEGGAGKDLYIVDSTGDLIIEAVGAGVDTVQSAVSFTLGANLENLVLTGSRAIDGSGDALDNRIFGNGAANTLRGFGGDDRLHGGGGADTMGGGAGDDLYFVDNEADRVNEGVGAGYDTVIASLSYTLAEGREVEKLMAGKTALGLILTGNSGANLIAGGAGGDSLFGLDGDDMLVGGGGNDLFLGGEGADTFRFEPGDIAASVFDADRISDFLSGVDRIDLSAIDADKGSAGDQAFTYIGEAEFSGVAGQLRAFPAEGGVIHESTVSGYIFIEGDADGDSVADFHLILTGNELPLTGDFVL